MRHHRPVESAKQSQPVLLGISACLLGECVRYDGSHKRERGLVDCLGSNVQWIGFCPEVEAGLSVPRPSLHLETASPHPRLLVTQTGEDLTERMTRWSECRLAAIEPLGLDGFVFKAGSPSCGIRGLRLYVKGRVSGRGGVGLFARMLMERWPDLPVEEEIGLRDPVRRRCFVRQVLTRAGRRDPKPAGAP